LLAHPDGKPLVPGGPAFFPQELSKQPGIQLLYKYHQTQLKLWTKANYGGTWQSFNTTWIPANTLNPLKILSLNRPTFAGMLLLIDMGRCSMAGRQSFDKCNGNYGHNYDITIVPGVFEKWSQSDPVTYVFTVRKGVLWPVRPYMARQDREVTAQDIVWFLETTKKEGILKDNFNLVKSFEAPDRYTVRITMQSPQAEFLRSMANTSMGIFSKECYEAKDCLGGDNFASPGPFLYNSSQSIARQRLVFERNAEFHLSGLPYVDRIVNIVITDPTAQQASFLTGQSDYINASNLTALQNRLKQQPDAQVFGAWVLAGNQVLRPQLKGALVDVRVRKALAMTMDLPTLWQVAYEGYTGFPNMVSRDTFGADFYYTLAQAGENYQFNPTKAKQLLTEAGYPNGFETSIMIASSSASGAYYDQLLFLQSQWKKHLNVDVKLLTPDPASFSTAQYGSSWPDLLWQAGWNLTFWADQDQALLQFVKGQAINLQKIDDPEFAALYQRESIEMDPAKRTAMLWEAEQLELSKVYVLRLAILTQFTIMQPWEMNGASHQVAWMTGFNGPTWLSMIDPAKAPKR
jgi:ABC-type transport system substrate-binding protein